MSKRNVWRSYPKNMLFARAISNAARWHCPDVFAGSVYTPEELEAQPVEVVAEAREEPEGDEAISNEMISHILDEADRLRLSQDQIDEAAAKACGAPVGEGVELRHLTPAEGQWLLERMASRRAPEAIAEVEPTQAELEAIDEQQAAEYAAEGEQQ